MRKGFFVVVVVLLVCGFCIHEYNKIQQLKLLILEQEEDRWAEFSELKKELKRLQKYNQKNQRTQLRKLNENIHRLTDLEQKIAATMNKQADKKQTPSKKKEISWAIDFDEANKVFRIQVKNYPKAQSDVLAKKIQFLSTCAATALLHQKSHIENAKVAECDSKWAKTIRWSLLLTEINKMVSLSTS